MVLIMSFFYAKKSPMTVSGQPGNHGPIVVKLVVMDHRLDFSMKLSDSLHLDLSLESG